jgi:hypothetical protein
MNRMASVAALTCSLVFPALSPALTQEALKGPHEGPPIQSMERDAQIDKAQKEEMKKQGRSTAAGVPGPAGVEGTGAEEERNVREGLEKPPTK